MVALLEGDEEEGDEVVDHSLNDIADEAGRHGLFGIGSHENRLSVLKVLWENILQYYNMRRDVCHAF